LYEFNPLNDIKDDLVLPKILPKKVFIKTFGCQMNEYDSSRMADMLHADNGMTQTDNVDEADVILLNTCSVREKAEEKVFSHLFRLKPKILIW